MSNSDQPNDGPLGNEELDEKCKKVLRDLEKEASGMYMRVSAMSIGKFSPGTQSIILRDIDALIQNIKRRL